MSGLVIIPGGWGSVDPRDEEHEARYGPQVDTAYEEDARRCQKEGHAQPLVKLCLRCGDVLGEVE